jgi:pimeloyl-ACP methyl ester carboxylesterase
MSKKTHLTASDLHGMQRLALDAVEGLTDLVEAVHMQFIVAPGITQAPGCSVTALLTGLAYKGVRGVTGLAAGALERVLTMWRPMLGAQGSSPEREAVLAALNGILGDHLEQSGNPLAIRMCLRREGQALELAAPALAQALPQAGPRLLILVHGLCRSDLQWHRRNHDHGAALARDLGYTVLYLHYNSGRHVSTNGRELATLLDVLVGQWPVPLERLALVGHSMGGLLIRSACHYGRQAGHGWLRQVRKIVFLGTPHHGAPLERGGHWLSGVIGKSPYVAPLARLGRVRSAGITDLRYGNLVDEDWAGRDRFDQLHDMRRAVPLPRGVHCYTMAATTGLRMGDLSDRLLGDGLVPLTSALGQHEVAALNLVFPKSRLAIMYDMHHLDLLSRPEAYQKLRRWLA